MAPLARKKSLLSETLPHLKELVIASHPDKGVLPASMWGGWREMRLPPDLAPACGAAMVVGGKCT